MYRRNILVLLFRVENQPNADREMLEPKLPRRNEI
jgi:hypothetical protein